MDDKLSADEAGN